MSGQQPNTLRDDEQPEYPFVGPFGGIQSEMPPDRIERLGFLDAANVMFRKGAAYTRPAVYQLPMLNGPAVGVADFFDSHGDRHQVAMSPTNVYVWDSSGGGTFGTITGTLTGTGAQLFTSTVVADKLCFCQGKDKVQLWDGLTAGFADASADAVPAKYLAELNFHLLACNTVESGSVATQRVRWTGADDPTDWTSFDAGQEDLFNDLGPITGVTKLYQQAYVFQQWGITQVVPTGIALAPFDFVPMGVKAKGNIAPYSLAAFGEDIACYIGKNNIYMFDGNQSTPIGDMPIDGARTRSGARKRVFADLTQCDLSTVTGYISTSINGNDYGCYWILMPELQAAWLYHFDEQNWTRWTFSFPPSIIGDFDKASDIRIMDLIGAILAQQWTPDTLINTNPLDSVFIGGNAGQAAYMDFSGVSEQPWQITSGNCFFGDFKHKKTISGFRLVLTDTQPNFSGLLTVAQNLPGAPLVTIPFGPVGVGSGATLVVVLPLSGANKITGTYIQWSLSGAAGAQLALSEITPIYDLGGDIRNWNPTTGLVD